MQMALTVQLAIDCLRKRAMCFIYLNEPLNYVIK